MSRHWLLVSKTWPNPKKIEFYYYFSVWKCANPSVNSLSLYLFPNGNGLNIIPWHRVWCALGVGFTRGIACERQYWLVNKWDAACRAVYSTNMTKQVYPDPPRRSRRLAGEAPQCAIVEDIQRRLRAIKKQTCPYCGKTFSGYKGGNCAHHIRKSLSF
jgi:hypothetical protein